MKGSLLRIMNPYLNVPLENAVSKKKKIQAHVVTLIRHLFFVVTSVERIHTSCDVLILFTNSYHSTTIKLKILNIVLPNSFFSNHVTF